MERIRPAKNLAVIYLAVTLLASACARTPARQDAAADLDASTRARLDAQVRTAPIEPTPQPPAKLEPSSRRGVEVLADVNITRLPLSNEAEVSLAQDRFAPRRVLAVTMTSPFAELLALVSNDRGRTFTTTRIAPPPGGSVMADPWVAFDARGVAHLAFLADTGFPRVSVTRSFDGGASWGAIQVLAPADKPVLIADDNPQSPFRDRVYVVWVIPLEAIRIARSFDGGASWETPRSFDFTNVNSADLAVAADGTLYVAAQNIGNGELYLWRSGDGGETFARATIGRLRARFRVGNPASCRRAPSVQMSLGVDRSGGPRHGDLYLVWSDYPPGIGPGSCGDVCAPATPCAPDVYAARSRDGGRTFSPPVRVHPADAPGRRSDQFHSIAAVDLADGALYVSYHDTRLAADRRSSHVFATRSRDGGRTFAPPVRISTAAGRSVNSFGHGDYRGMVVRGGQAVSVWADFRADQNRGEIYANRTVFAVGGGGGGDGGGGGGGGDDCALPPGHPRLCRDCGPCGAGAGDCDGDAQCAPGLSCIDDVGADFGYPPGIDVCVASDGGGGGGPGACPLPAGHPRLCRDCGPCGTGQGDCDGDAECAPGLSCVDDAGPAFGFGPKVDVCQ